MVLPPAQVPSCLSKPLSLSPPRGSATVTPACRNVSCTAAELWSPQRMLQCHGPQIRPDGNVGSGILEVFSLIMVEAPSPADTQLRALTVTLFAKRVSRRSHAMLSRWAHMLQQCPYERCGGRTMTQRECAQGKLRQRWHEAPTSP